LKKEKRKRKNHLKKEKRKRKEELAMSKRNSIQYRYLAGLIKVFG
jgi:hypothetical protein